MVIIHPSNDTEIVSDTKASTYFYEFLFEIYQVAECSDIYVILPDKILSGSQW